MREIIIANWQEFTNFLEKSEHLRHANGYKHIQFRGHSDKAWKLESSLKRLIGSMEIDEAKAVYYEKQAVSEYQEQQHLSIRPTNYILPSCL